MPIGLVWVDIALAAFLAVSVLIGLMRGFVFELLSLAGWFVAFIAARWLAPAVQMYIPLGDPGSALNHGAAFAAVFLVTLVGWGFASRLVRVLVRATPLGVPDRLLGAMFGALRGIIILLLLALLIGMSPLESTLAWRQSLGAAWLSVAVQSIKGLWPGVASPDLPA